MEHLLDWTKPHFAAWIQGDDLDRHWAKSLPLYMTVLKAMFLYGFRSPWVTPSTTFNHQTSISTRKAQYETGLMGYSALVRISIHGISV